MHNSRRDRSEHGLLLDPFVRELEERLKCCPGGLDDVTDLSNLAADSIGIDPLYPIGKLFQDILDSVVIVCSDSDPVRV